MVVGWVVGSRIPKFKCDTSLHPFLRYQFSAFGRHKVHQVICWRFNTKLKAQLESLINQDNSRFQDLIRPGKNLQIYILKRIIFHQDFQIVAVGTLASTASGEMDLDAAQAMLSMHFSASPNWVRKHIVDMAIAGLGCWKHGIKLKHFCPTWSETPTYIMTFRGQALHHPSCIHHGYSYFPGKVGNNHGDTRTLEMSRSRNMSCCRHICNNLLSTRCLIQIPNTLYKTW